MFAHPRPVILALLTAAFLLLPSMASVGMFLDGTIYAAVSRNLAEGFGSFWAPHFSEGLFPVFREHLPLVFWVQSLFFRVLGDSYLTERAYDLSIVLLTGWLVWRLWLRLVQASGRAELAGYFWLPLLLWVIGPKWSWAYRNNVLENTMTLLCLAVVVLVFDALRAGSGRRAAIAALAASAFTLAALLSKGPTALFVLAAPALLAPAAGFAPDESGRRIVGVAAVYWLSAAAMVMALLMVVPAARELLSAYWSGQIGARAGLDIDGLAILFELLKKLAPMLIIVGGVAAWRRADAGNASRSVARQAVALLSLGAAASVPLILADRDSAHYLVPALPLYALGFGLAGAALLASAGERTRKLLKERPGPLFVALAVSGSVAIAVMCAGRVGEVRKNRDHHALFVQADRVIGGEGRRTLGIAPALERDWTLHAIAQRHYRISLQPGAHRAEWWLAPVGAGVPTGLHVRALRHESWVLWRRGGPQVPSTQR